jgi:integrase
MATVVIQKRKRQARNSYIVYYKDPASGRRKYYRTFQRQKDAQQSANDLRALLDAGKVSEVRKSKLKLNLLSFEEVSDCLKSEWENKLEHSGLGKKTFEDYVFWVRYVGKIFGKRLLCEISREDILEYRNTIAKEISNITSNRSLFIIKQVFKHGIELNAIKNNLVAPIPYLSEKEHQRNVFLKPIELDKLIEASKQLRTKYYLPALIYLGAEHGASKQEALDLKWADIDFDFEGTGLIRLFRTKTKRERTEFLMPRTKRALLEWREHQRWMRHRKRIEDTGPGFVFCRLNGTPIKRFDKSWGQVRKIAGFNGLHFHDLRHTFCSNLLLSGSDLKDVKEMIGHKDLSMTDRYTHLTALRKLAKQENLARFYTNGNGDEGSSGEHIGNTEG